jgi:hypothetical protein
VSSYENINHVSSQSLMRRIFFSIAVMLASSVITGCATSTTVSQYAGLPRHLLPKDHLDYRPLNVTRAPKIFSSSVRHAANSTEDPLGEEENIHLAKMMRICQSCMPITVPSTSYESAESLQAHDAAIARALREIQARP